MVTTISKNVSIMLCFIRSRNGNPNLAITLKAMLHKTNFSRVINRPKKSARIIYHHFQRILLKQELRRFDNKKM